MRFDDIELFPRSQYEIDVILKDLPWHLENWVKNYGLTLDPDYQRAHVWTEAQQVAYVEYVLRGGEVGKVIIVNAPGFNEGTSTVAEIVDGKQRLTAMTRFITNELRIFGTDGHPGHLYREIEGRPRMMIGFKWRVVDLDRKGILKLYLSLNGGGTQHTHEELDRVRVLLAKEI